MNAGQRVAKGTALKDVALANLSVDSPIGGACREDGGWAGVVDDGDGRVVRGTDDGLNGRLDRGTDRWWAGHLFAGQCEVGDAMTTHLVRLVASQGLRIL